MTKNRDRASIPALIWGIGALNLRERWGYRDQVGGMNGTEADKERARIAREAIALIARRGESVTRAVLAVELRIPRPRIDAMFPEESDLFAAVVDEWYAHDAAFMEQIVASDLPINRKMYEFFVQRFRREKERYDRDPATFALFVELGQAEFELVRGYIELADHHLAELIAEAQADGFFAGLTVDQTLTLINQMVFCYTSPQVMLVLHDRLNETKLAAIIDTLFAGLSAADGGARGLDEIRMA